MLGLGYSHTSFAWGLFGFFYRTIVELFPYLPPILPSVAKRMEVQCQTVFFSGDSVGGGNPVRLWEHRYAVGQYEQMGLATVLQNLALSIGK